MWEDQRAALVSLLNFGINKGFIVELSLWWGQDFTFWPLKNGRILQESQLCNTNRLLTKLLDPFINGYIIFKYVWLYDIQCRRIGKKHTVVSRWLKDFRSEKKHNNDAHLACFVCFSYFAITSWDIILKLRYFISQTKYNTNFWLWLLKDLYNMDFQTAKPVNNTLHFYCHFNNKTVIEIIPLIL